MTEQPVKQMVFQQLMDSGNQRIAEIKALQNTKVTNSARNVGFVAMSTVGVMAFGLLFFQVVTGVIALGLSVAAILGLFYGFRFLKMADPLIKQKMNNKLLKSMFEEAKKNKIETLTQMLLTSNERLEVTKKSLDKMGGYVNRLKAKLDSSDKGSSSYSKKVELFNQVETVYDLMKVNTQTAIKKHKDLEEKVAEFKDMHEFTEIMTGAMEFANQSMDKKLEELLGFEAFASIEREFHEAVATVENSASNYSFENQL